MGKHALSVYRCEDWGMFITFNTLGWAHSPAVAVSAACEEVAATAWLLLG